MLEFALVRSPGVEFEKGITTAGMGLPDMEKARRQHGAYVKALKFCGLDVKVMEPLRGYPDACFVEDTAVVVGKEVVICRPGAEERRGEEETVADNLKKLFQKIRRIESPGTVDGGRRVHLLSACLGQVYAKLTLHMASVYLLGPVQAVLLRIWSGGSGKNHRNILPGNCLSNHGGLRVA